MYEGLLNDLRKANLQQILSWIEEVLYANETKILYMARKRMKLGEGVSGGIIGQYKSVAYQMFKLRENPMAGGDVDLFLTGALQRDMEIQRVAAGEYKILSNDIKYSLMADKYGENQFGITEEEHNQVMGIVVNYVIDKINKYYE